MLKKIKTMALALVLPLALAAPLALAGPTPAVYAGNDCNGIQGSLSQGVNNAVGTDGCEVAEGSGETDLASIAARVVNLLSWVIGIIAVIMIIVAGFRYIASGGASDKVSGAKNTLIYAIVGLIIVALAQAIVRFVLTNVPS